MHPEEGSQLINAVCHPGPCAGMQYIPEPVNHHRGKRLLLGQHVVECMVDRRQFGGTDEGGLGFSC